MVVAIDQAKELTARRFAPVRANVTPILSLVKPIPDTTKPPILPQQRAQIKMAVKDLVDRMGVELTGKVIEKFGHLFLPMLVRVKSQKEYEQSLSLIENLARNYFQSRVQEPTPVSQDSDPINMDALYQKIYEKFPLSGVLATEEDKQKAARASVRQAIKAQARIAFGQSNPLAEAIQEISDMAAE